MYQISIANSKVHIESENFFSVTVFHDLNMQPMSDTGNQYNSNNIVNIVTSPTKHWVNYS